MGGTLTKKQWVFTLKIVQLLRQVSCDESSKLKISDLIIILLFYLFHTSHIQITQEDHFVCLWCVLRVVLV